MPVFPPKENKSCTGKDKSQGEPRVKYGDEYVGKQGALANDNTHRHHGGHRRTQADEELSTEPSIHKGRTQLTRKRRVTSAPALREREPTET